MTERSNMAENKTCLKREDYGTKTLALIEREGLVKAITLRQYSSDLAVFTLFTKKDFLDTKSGDVLRYLQHLTEKSLAKSTVRRIIAVLNSIYEHMVLRRDALGIPEATNMTNPFTAYLPKDETDDVDEKNIAPLESVQHILAANKKDMVISGTVLLCLKLLLHARELADLKASDVFTTEYEGRTVLALHVGKGATERDMLVPSDMVQMLTSMRDDAVKVGGEEGWLFYKRDGGRLSLPALQRRLYRLAQAEGCEKSLNFNSIRNLGISLCEAPDEVLDEHLSFESNRHFQRVVTLRNRAHSTNFGTAGESIGVTVHLVKGN